MHPKKSCPFVKAIANQKEDICKKASTKFSMFSGAGKSLIATGIGIKTLTTALSLHSIT